MPKEESTDYTIYLDKPATDLQERFAEWLQGPRVGYDPNSAKNKAAAFAEGVRLGVALRIPFQASEENRAATEEARERRIQEREDLKAARKTRAAAAAPVEPETAPRAAKATKAAAKSAPAARGRGRATASASTEAPF